jgi:PIN domain nuclease of toxin-antitoxin system
MSLKEAAAREAYLKTLLDVVNDAYKEARAETQTLLDTAAEETGARQVAVTLPDGPDIATVSLASGETAAKVIDEDKFTAWVRENFASEIERRFVTTVREAFTKKLLAELTAAGGTEWPDPETGVIHEVPGVAIAPARARTHAVRFKKDGREQVMAAWREGRISAVALPELTAGGAE